MRKIAYRDHHHHYHWIRTANERGIEVFQCRKCNTPTKRHWKTSRAASMTKGGQIACAPLVKRAGVQQRRLTLPDQTSQRCIRPAGRGRFQPSRGSAVWKLPLVIRCGAQARISQDRSCLGWAPDLRLIVRLSYKEPSLSPAGFQAHGQLTWGMCNAVDVGELGGRGIVQWWAHCR